MEDAGYYKMLEDRFKYLREKTRLDVEEMKSIQAILSLRKVPATDKGVEPSLPRVDSQADMVDRLRQARAEKKGMTECIIMIASEKSNKTVTCGEVRDLFLKAEIGTDSRKVMGSVYTLMLRNDKFEKTNQPATFRLKHN